jgi:biopolymer transport protein ExbD
MRLRKSYRRVTCELGVAPLIDVVFLLIIFFMTVTQLTRVGGEPVQLPEAQTRELEGEMPTGIIVITVQRAGQITVNGQSHTLTTLGQLLSAATRGKPANGVPVLIRADEYSLWDQVGQVMRICAANRLTKVRVAVTEPGPEKAPT